MAFTQWNSERATMARYALTDYKVAVLLPDALRNRIFANSGNATNNGTTNVGGVERTIDFVFGGDDSYTQSISVQYRNQLFSVQGDATGSWVYTKSRDRTGSVTFSMNQVAPNVGTLIDIFNIYFNDISDTEGNVLDGFTLVITNRQGDTVCTCEDCYVTGVPNQSFSSTPSAQSWQIASGRITMGGGQ